MYEYRCKIVRVVDGDTVHAAVDLGCDTTIRLTLRLAGLNAPERGTPEGDEATEWLRDKVLDEQVMLRTIKDRREKYGRYLAWLYVLEGPAPNEWRCLNERMIGQGYAERYGDLVAPPPPEPPTS